jgi:hypothetical protein
LGYSARYHAASLAAVFLALAVGILIGAGLGDSVLSDTEESLRDSLEQDIDDARADADELRVELERERAFSDQAYPALVGEALDGREIGILALGQLSPEVSADVEDALEPTGAELASVAVLREPPDTPGFASRLGPRYAGIEDDNGELEVLGVTLGTQFVLGRGRQLEDISDLLFLRSSGEGGLLDGVVIVRGTEEPSDDEGRSAALIEGMISGITDTGVTTVAVERSDVEESSIPFFGPFDVASVDSVDLTSGKVALVFALLGAEGSFGIKGTANTLLPELLEPSGQTGP